MEPVCQHGAPPWGGSELGSQIGGSRGQGVSPQMNLPLSGNLKDVLGSEHPGAHRDIPTC